MREDLTGNIYGNLTIIEKTDSIIGGKTKKRKWGAWKCLCKCGRTIIAKTVHLKRGNVKSCGCLISEFGKALNPNQIFGRLKTVKYNKGKWLCICQCGNEVYIKTASLKNGNTKSCGCWNEEVRKTPDKLRKLQDGRRKFEPEIALARRIWKRYYYRENDKNDFISFEDFLAISQLPCYYCGIEPGKIYKGNFIYNGMDRLDSGLNHRKDNVVPCCLLCNRAKNNLSISSFIERINQFIIKKFKPIIIKQVYLPTNSYLKTSINCIYYNYRDGDLKIEEFYYLSQLPCFYCNVLNSCVFNYAKNNKRSSKKAIKNASLYYNGLDRIDSKLGHWKENVVPCCKYCNFAKGELSLREYQDWMRRTKDNIEIKRADFHLPFSTT